MADLGSPWVWKIPWRREWLPVPVFWPHLLVYQDDRVEGTLEGHKQILVCTRTQEKGAVTPQEIEPDLPVTVQESLVEVWVDSGLPSVRGTNDNSPGRPRILA